MFGMMICLVWHDEAGWPEVYGDHPTTGGGPEVQSPQEPRASSTKRLKDTLRTSPHAAAAEAGSLSAHLSLSLWRDVLGGGVRLEASTFG